LRSCRYKKQYEAAAGQLANMKRHADLRDKLAHEAGLRAAAAVGMADKQALQVG
jgi:hypothetical protein